MAPKTKTTFSLLALKSSISLAALLGLTWVFFGLEASAASDTYRALGSRLLQFESIRPASAIEILQQSGRALGECETDAQHAMLLIEVPLAEISLRSGSAADFDRHISAIESRSRHLLSCTPRDSFAWLLLFGVEIEHGDLDVHSFDLLEMSYETSPNEAWIGTRRVAIALPVILAAPTPVQQKLLAEFQSLVRSGFLDVTATSYRRAPSAVRALLQSRIDELDPSSKKAFSEALSTGSP